MSWSRSATARSSATATSATRRTTAASSGSTSGATRTTELHAELERRALERRSAAGVVRAVADERDDELTPLARGSAATDHIRASYRMGSTSTAGRSRAELAGGRRASGRAVEGVDEPLLYELNAALVRRPLGPHADAVRRVAALAPRAWGSTTRRSGSSPRSTASPAGVAICRLHDHGDPDRGWVSVLGVLPRAPARGARHGAADPRLRGVPAPRPAPRRARRRRGEHDRRRHACTSAPGCAFSGGGTSGRGRREHAPRTCPDCRTLTAVAFDDGYECHSCGAAFAAGLVRVPRAWGAGGESMADAASLAAPVSGGARRRRATTLEEQSAAVARRSSLSGRSCWAAAAARTSARSAGSPRVTTDSPSSGSTRTATSTRPRRRRRGTRGGCRSGWRSTKGSVATADVALVGARDLDPPEQAYVAEHGIDDDLDRALDGRRRGLRRARRGRARAGHRAVLLPGARAGPGADEVEAVLRDVAAASPVAGMGLTGLAPDADPAVARRASRLPPVSEPDAALRCVGCRPPASIDVSIEHKRADPTDRDGDHTRTRARAAARTTATRSSPSTCASARSAGTTSPCARRSGSSSSPTRARSRRKTPSFARPTRSTSST